MRCDELNSVAATTAMKLAGVRGIIKDLECCLEKLKLCAQRATSTIILPIFISVRHLLSASKMLRI